MVFADNQKGAYAMCHYKHLTIEERENLYLMKGQQRSIRSIARELGRSPSTISRELKRGHSGHHPYRPSVAQYRYEKRRENCGRKSSLADPACKELVRKLITEQQWSPEEIAARLKHEGNPVQVSYGAIYRAIHAGLLDGPKVDGHIRKASRFSTNLRRKGKKYRRTGEAGKQGRFVIQHHLKDRPEEANNRTVIGHFEGDTVSGKLRSDSLVTLTDRCSRFTLAAKVPNKAAETVRDKIIELLSQLPDGVAKSVTPDRGKEFARYQEVTDNLPQVTFYFPPPYSPWERGTNENTNGLLREYFPKYQDIAPVSEMAVLEAVEKLNTRPRKCLGWKTPYEVFFDCVLHLT